MPHAEEHLRPDRPIEVAPAPELLGVLSRDGFDEDALALAEQSAGIGVWSIDLTTGLVRATAQFFRIMGLTPTRERVPIDALRALRHPDDRERVVDGFQRALSGGTDAYENEYRIVRPDGETRWIFGRGRVVRDAQGHPIRYSGIDLDITDRKAAEAALAAATAKLEELNRTLEQRVQERTAELQVEARRRADAEARLHQAQKMEAIGQLTSGIAHDFNNILQVILGHLEIAQLTLHRLGPAQALGDKRSTLLAAIDTASKASQSAGQLVQRLLAFSRQQPLEPGPVEIGTLIGAMVEMVKRLLGERIHVETHLEPTPAVFVDRNQLESALLNLALNARDAMPDGGLLMIETRTVEAESREEMPAGRYVMLAVSDTGCGIAADALRRVFEPFYSTKDAGKGTGLGLSMVKSFVRQYGGYVKVHSEVGVGTTFKLYFPPRAEAVRTSPTFEAAAAAPRPQLPRAKPGEAVLVVEDNDAVRQLCVTALQDLGYRVLEARDAARALELCADASPPRIDLLFTDIVLPGNVDGQSLSRTVRERYPGTRVLYTSGYTRNAMVQQGRIVAEARVLTKPYSIDALAIAVREAIDSGN